VSSSFAVYRSEASVTDRWFEDYQVGTTESFGPVTVTEEEILDFARRYDPQPFHTDPTAAKDGPFGGLIASGWHTASLMMRLLVDNYLSPASSLGSPGIDQLRWPNPVRPGDDLTMHIEVLEARASQTRPDRGIVRTSTTLTNQDNLPVLTVLGTTFIRTRPQESPTRDA
jgi:acyl dehydratase